MQTFKSAFLIPRRSGKAISGVFGNCKTRTHCSTAAHVHLCSIEHADVRIAALVFQLWKNYETMLCQNDNFLRLRWLNFHRVLFGFLSCLFILNKKKTAKLFSAILQNANFKNLLFYTYAYLFLLLFFLSSQFVKHQITKYSVAAVLVHIFYFFNQIINMKELLLHTK